MVSVKNNVVYFKVDGYHFNEKKEAAKSLGFRWNPVSKLWYGPKSLYNKIWQVDAETPFTKEEWDEADAWFEKWWNSLLTPELFEEKVDVKNDIFY